MLHKILFCLSGKVVRTAKGYLCNQGGTASLFLSRLAFHILNLADKHGITLTAANIPTHLNVEANYLPQGRLVPEMHLVP